MFPWNVSFLVVRPQTFDSVRDRKECIFLCRYGVLDRILNSSARSPQIDENWIVWDVCCLRFLIGASCTLRV